MMGAQPGFAKRALALGAFIAAAAAIFLMLLNVAGGMDVGKRYRFTAVVPTAVQLADNADVKQAGVDIGKVTQISNRGATAVIELAIDPDRGPVHRDARMQVRTKTLVGENYVSLDPGTPASPALPAGGVLALQQAKPSVQLDEILSAISAKRRAHLRRLLSGLGRGVGDSATVNDTIGGLADTVSSGSKVVDALAVQREALANLVTDLAIVFRAVGERRVMIQQLVRGAQRAATALATEQDALRAALRQLPPTLVATQRTTTHLAAVGDHAAPVLDDLTASLAQLTPLARELPAATKPTLRALRRLAGASPAAIRLLRSLRRAAGPLTSTVPALDDTLREVRPALRYLAPYSKDAAAFFATTGQAISARDATGTLARLRPIISTSFLATLGPREQRIIRRLLGMGIGDLVNMRGTNAYPTPASGATPQAFTGPYPRVRRDGKR